ncbi:MAG: Invasion protein B, involved in pathogenesis [Rhodobacteraceae bacterium HLUCCA12]|nr:MAG: Invasion protein B, involved in pathogenesis [Rhodobacteraceae bacterium HLUCCA12]
MTMRTALCTTTLAALLSLPHAALAQEAVDAQPESETPAGEPYLAETYDDWEILCTQFEDADEEVCEMYQLLLDEEESPIAEISIAALPPDSEVAAGATITTPLETFLPAGVGWSIGDDDNMRVEGFRMCAAIGCIARVGFNQDEIDEMKAGSHANITIAPFVAIDQPIDIRVSLIGFTAALEDLQSRLPEAAPEEE